MAARTTKIRHDGETRAKIRASQLINRLTDHVLGKVEMVPSQVSAGLGLLRKVLPDLGSVAHTGADGAGPIKLEAIHRVIVDPRNPDGAGVPAAADPSKV